MLTKRIPVSSLTAGALNDGALVGQINESLHHLVLTNAQMATNRYVVRLDYDIGQFVDLTASLDAVQNVSLWGSVAQMSAGDGVLIACDDDVEEIRLNVGTAGVGTWTGLQVYASTDGVTFNRELTGLTGSHNALKSSGWVNLVMPNTVGGANVVATRVALRPSPILSGNPGALRKWLLVKPSGASFTVTTAPVVSAIAVKHPDTVERWLDLTATVNGTSVLGAGNVSVAADLPGGAATTVTNEGLATTGAPTIDTTTIPGETIIRWATPGTHSFTVPLGVTASWVLLVAGGAGGGTNHGGGGGGGANLGLGGNGGSGVAIVRFPTQTRSYQTLQAFANDAAAATGGLLTGQFYRDSSTSAVRQRVS